MGEDSYRMYFSKYSKTARLAARIYFWFVLRLKKTYPPKIQDIPRSKEIYITHKHFNYTHQAEL